MRSHTTAWPRRIAFLAVLALLVSVPTTPRTAQPTETVTLAWDGNNGATRGYRVHVGTQSRAYSQSYDVGRATSFVFADGIPGTLYYFAVSAYDADQLESPYSNEVSHFIGGAPEPPVIAQSPDEPRIRESHGASALATALGPVSGMAALPDGRVLFVEDGSRVRMLARSGLAAASVLSTDDDAVQFTELVVDPSFGHSAFVFVGTTEPQRLGHRDFRVSRYRLVGDALGEGATVVGGLSFQGDHAPRFTVDNAGRIYVAMPGLGAARTDPYAGRVLRFAADGSVPEDHRGASPVLAYSFQVPLDLDWDGRGVWIVGLDERSRPAIGLLRLDTDDDEWPQRLSRSGLEIPPGLEVLAFDVSASIGAEPSPASGVVVDTTHRLHRVTTAGIPSTIRVDAMTWSADGLPLDVTVGPLGSIHAVIRTATGSFAIVEVTDRR